jgi:hypothetical protein
VMSTVPVREFERTAELVAHYRVVHHRAFYPLVVPAQLPEEAPAAEKTPAAAPQRRLPRIGHLTDDQLAALARRIAVRRAARNNFDEPPDLRVVKVEELVKLVCETTGIRRVEMLSKRRAREFVRARQIIMWLSARYTTKSLVAIGKHLGDLDHTTVLHGARFITKLVARVGPSMVDTPQHWAAHLWEHVFDPVPTHPIVIVPRPQSLSSEDAA